MEEVLHADNVDPCHGVPKLPAGSATDQAKARSKLTRSSPTTPPAPQATPEPMTYGFGEFAVATGRLVAILAPTVDKTGMAANQRLMWSD